MRLIALCVALLLVLIQYPLWFGHGGWLKVWELDQQVMASQKHIDELKARNAKLASEVNDLKDGTGAVEERARYELGMIKEDEIFVQILDANAKAPVSLTAPLPVPADQNSPTPSSTVPRTPASTRTR